MAWYDDTRTMAHVETYADDKEANKDAERAYPKGWQVKDTVSDAPGPVNRLKTIAKAVLIVPYLRGGASRRPGKVTLTYVRTSKWLAGEQQ